MPSPRRINVDGVARLPAFSHASIVGDQIWVAGTLGTAPGALELVPGGVGAQTTQALRNVETILGACGATLRDVVKVNVFLTDMTTFAEMNEAYVEVFGAAPPARITVGCADLALGVGIELDCVAAVPS